MKAILTFSPNITSSRSFTRIATGVVNLKHAEIIGHGLVGSLSIHYGVALHLQGVQLDNASGDFIANPLPEYFREGVEITED